MFGNKKSFGGGVELLVVGLGNPDKKYENTRHNAGWLAIDAIAESLDCKVDRVKFKSYVGECNIAGRQAVVEAMNFYKISPENVIVLFDDISLDVGKMRIRSKGSDGGQRGMKSIIYLSGSDKFPRVKIGIGAKPTPEWDLADWVLSRFSDDEQKKLAQVFENAAKAVELMADGKIDRAMNLFN